MLAHRSGTYGFRVGEGLAKVDFDLEAVAGWRNQAPTAAIGPGIGERISEADGDRALAAKLRSGLHTRYPERRCLAEGFR